MPPGNTESAKTISALACTPSGSGVFERSWRFTSGLYPNDRSIANTLRRGCSFWVLHLFTNPFLRLKIKLVYSSLFFKPRASPLPGFRSWFAKRPSFASFMPLASHDQQIHAENDSLLADSFTVVSQFGIIAVIYKPYKPTRCLTPRSPKAIHFQGC